MRRYGETKGFCSLTCGRKLVVQFAGTLAFGPIRDIVFPFRLFLRSGSKVRVFFALEKPNFRKLGSKVGSWASEVGLQK